MVTYLNLLVGCDSTEDYLCEALRGKHPKTDASDDAAVFYEGQGLVLPVKINAAIRRARWHLKAAGYESAYLRIKYQPCDVLFGHARQLMGENILQADQPHQNLLVGFLGKRVSDDVELYDATPLLQSGSLIAGSVGRQQVGLAA